MLTPVYYLADNFSLLTNCCLFITGKAGTGKTTFLKQLREKIQKQMVVAAPTGVAAINAGGTTLHSLFQLPFTPFLPTEESRKNLIAAVKMRADRRKVLYEMELLVIDEVSMVRADVLDAVDTLLRHFKYRQNEPFGGVQVVLIGDMFQLSPVVQDEEWHILQNYYRSPFFFQSKVLEQLHPVYIELDTIFRQQDQIFINILNQVRNNCLTQESLNRLNACYQPNYVNTEENFHITLTTHNYKADKINVEELAKIDQSTEIFTAKISGEFPEKNYPADEVLKLKIGAKVMFVKNDEQHPRRFYNGKIGVVKEFLDETILVESEGEIIGVPQMQWKNIRYHTDDKTKQIQEEELGTFTQYPLRLAWAITIHKSQGLTFEKVLIDAEQAFAAGQVYVALSRCRSLEGIVMLSKINTSSLRNATEILEMEQSKLPTLELEKKLATAKIDYKTLLFTSVFDYRNNIGQTERLINYVKEHAAQFNDQSISYLTELIEYLKDVQNIGIKFQQQIRHILQQESYQELLQQRIAAAADYFREKNRLFTELLMQLPVRTDVRACATELNEGIKTLYGNIMQKTALMDGLKTQASIENYFTVRQNYAVPAFKINVYAGAIDELKESSEHPVLLNQLFALRNKICREQHLPLYIVGSSNMLIEISNRLPQTEKGLLHIKGFGKAKYIRFGQQFLQLINDYIQKNDLQIEQTEIEEEQEKQKVKRQKGDSQRITLAYYNEGKTIDQIADERNLSPTTIVGHLYTFVRLRQLPLSDFLSDEKREKAFAIMKEDNDTDMKYALLDDLLSQNERAMFFCWMRDKIKS